MRVFLLLGVCFVWLLANDFRSVQIQVIDQTIKILQKRLECTSSHSALTCIERFPLDKKEDTLDKAFLMSFPQAFYEAKMKRSIRQLQHQKLCIGKALTLQEAKKCTIE